MSKKRISLIAAIGRNGELGKDNKLLWDIPEDMEHFRSTTAGHAVIMGRKTHESIGRLLPGRANIIVTRDPSFKAEGGIVAGSLEEAIIKAKEIEKKEIFVIGGGQIYQEALPRVDKLYLTIVEGTFDADTFFPDYSQFEKVVSEQKGESGGYKYTFLELER